MFIFYAWIYWPNCFSLSVKKCDKSSNEVFDTHKGLCYSLCSHWSPAHSPGLRDEAPAHYTVGLSAAILLHRAWNRGPRDSTGTRTRPLEIQILLYLIQVVWYLFTWWELYLLVRSPAESPLFCVLSEELLDRLLADISKHTGQLLLWGEREIGIGIISRNNLL